jgi:type III restriction enzyme
MMSPSDTALKKWKEFLLESKYGFKFMRIKDKTGRVSEANRNQILAAFGVIKRKGTKSLRLKIEARDLIKKSTREINKSSFGIGSLRRDSTVFWDDYSMTLGEAADKKILKELEEDESLPRFAFIKVENKYNFKSPFNVALASYKPERKFIKGIISEQNAQVINAWIKSSDAGFYDIEYSWRKGEHPKRGGFNPDFFIKLEKDIIVVEIKMDGDVSDENKAKLRYAKEHFNRVNKLQKEQKYYFKFLSSISYDLFFKALREDTYRDFKSELEAKLEAEK